MILMIDNYDSFTFNLVHYLEALDYPVLVKRNDEITLAEINEIAPSHIVISPGPCTPNESGVSLDVIQHFSGTIPLLGVCLGHQSLIQQFGGNIKRANQPMHGKTSEITHTQQGMFSSLKTPLTVARYHSLVADLHSLPDCFDVTAWTESSDGSIHEIMAVQHKTLPIHGIQFHPEAIQTEHGKCLLNNFLTLTEIHSTP